MTIYRLNVFFIIGALSILISLAVLNYSMLAVKKKESEVKGDFLISTYNIANELRQSSEDMTRMARTYVITGEKKYKENYFIVFGIRNGNFPRPKDYSETFWNIHDLESISNDGGDYVSLREMMTNMGFLDEELKLLDMAQSRSDKLVSLELEAFSAMDGLFVDEKGHYTIKGTPDQRYASELLFGSVYHNEKEKIMEPIEDFITAVKKRVAIESIRFQEVHEILLIISLVVIVTGILITFFIGYYVWTQVTSPLQKLRNKAIEIASGHYGTRTNIRLNNEIGILGHSIDNMAEAIESHISELSELATTDPLTKLNNRRSIFDKLENELKRFKRNGKPFSVLMLDVDHFKSINDRFGHSVGDFVLRSVSDICTQELREVDAMGRTGGEEFIILLPETNGDNAEIIAERIRKNVEETIFLIDENEINVTVSFGIAESVSEDTKEDLIKRSDQAMYISKENGRNQVTKDSK